MSISALGSQSSPQNLLLSDLKSNGLSSDVATQVESEIKSIFEQGKSGSAKPNPTDIRAAIDQKLKDDVAAGNLTQDQADSVTKALDQFEQQIKQQHDTAQTGGGGGGKAPDPAELFSKLDGNGDGKLSKDEFVSGRPDNVSEEEAGKLYDKIAEKGGGDATAGLSQDQFATGFQAAAPQGGGGAPPAGGGGGSAGGGGGSAGGDSGGSSTTVTDVKTTTSADGTKTTVTKYADGTSTTTVTYGQSDSSSASSLQSILKSLTQGKSDSTDTASYLNKLLSGSLIDTQA